MSYISTNDLDLFIHGLLEERILYNQNLANFTTGAVVKDYIPTQFKGGKVIDNWGVDLFKDDNLQELQNEIDTEYLVTYRRENTDLYDDTNCNNSITYDFSVMMKDCPNAKSRLNLILDELIYYLHDPARKFGIYTKILTTRVDFSSSSLVDNRTYTTNLNHNQVLLRKDCFYEELTAKSTVANFLTSLFTIKFQITIKNN
jgi:hypothetical protein